MLNFTKDLPTGVSATVALIIEVSIHTAVDVAAVRVQHYLDQTALDGGKEPLEEVEVSIPDVSKILNGAPDYLAAIEQAVLGDPSYKNASVAVNAEPPQKQVL